VQRVKLQKSLAFRTLAITNISAYTTGSIVGIVMAYRDWGVWSLVTMQVLYAAIAVVLLAIITHWHPSFCFSKESMKELFGFGGFIMAASILQEVCKNLQGILIGKKFSATQMGYFSQAYKLDNITSYSIPQVIVQVMYPVYSSIQDERERLNDMVLMNIRVISFLIFPLLALLILIGEPLITLLYGDKWLPAVPYFQVLCIGGFFVCLQNVNFYAVAAVGKSKQLFYWSFYKWGVLLVALITGMTIGMYGILWGMVLSNVNIFLVNCFLASRHVGIRVGSQLKGLLPMTLATGVSFLLTCAVNLFYPSLPIAIVLFLTSYVTISYACRFKALDESILLIKKLLHR
ncbi:MAG: lipopolysaccharide biosynthesis protein, partial [Muribaculaceae bacterium]|nr:lipopolysaccharide biosynthesis protein [Muribaculaceae bacterium]